MVYRRTAAVQERLDAARSRIVTAALSLVAERGYAACSMADVAARAGIGVGTVYRYFPGKGELFAEVFRDACSREVAAATAAGVRAAATGTHTDSLLASVRTFCDRACRAPTLAYALLAEPIDALVDTERLAFRQSFADAFAAAIRAAVEAGELPDQDAPLTAACIVGAIGEALVVPLARGEADARVLAALETFTLRALGAPTDRRAS
ncbi:TetR/AcrR family transcriptional regulator [Rhodococcus sp. BP-241]|uniref:TetR/AcrR family transcriptional regulator n=1 Tax=unclassified Rhodococcus (in: high G+C Gram-positive bacteria) TaxID=192944 RepID=UPI001C9A5481|nr:MULTISPECIES: TetR/AcrR family transcriptional regulator [unclassified Rhodococcus (in: high G+C Gram-positive bacteria)]MBY6706634.1 TetR/AcrR family transcriptional regulator [Rhodococcus sp. BP-241]